MFKKLILIFSLLSLCLNITAFAENPVELSVTEDFCVHSESPAKLAEILGITESELNEYCRNNSILYLAANGDNSKQIRITVSENEFSNSVINLSNLSNDKIEGLASDIAGIENLMGQAVNLNGQKFLKTELRSSDSGGEYILTQYITVAEKQNIVLSFYTSGSLDTDYTEAIFLTLSSPMFITEESEMINAFSVVIPIATVVFLLVCIGLGISIVIDLKRQKEAPEEQEQEQEETETEKEKEE